MKKAILQLYQEATGEDYLYDFDPVIAEKFAELIVRECAEFVACGEFGDPGMAKAIKEHFGVEK